jgi:hypothetical protein
MRGMQGTDQDGEVQASTRVCSSREFLSPSPHIFGIETTWDLKASKLDEHDNKSKFREAQARIGLGEVTLGKKLLQDLLKVRFQWPINGTGLMSAG